MFQLNGKSALKILLGLVFIVSAVLKILEIDRFEIYLYSFHFFSLNFSYLVARAAIILELVLGIGLVANYLHKLIWWGSVGMLMGYSLLLLYAIVVGRTDSCHCFGDFLQLNAQQSLIKNAVLLALFFLIYNMEGWETPFRWLLLSLSIIVSTTGVFLISPPDNYADYTSEHNLQVELFNEMLDESPLDQLNLREGKQIICFFSTSCDYCQMAARKLTLMQQFYGFPPKRITYAFIGSKGAIKRFFDQSDSERYRTLHYSDVAAFLKAVNGNLPVVVLLQDGEVVHEYGFRNMDEEEIKAFMAPEVVEPVETPR